MADTFFVRWRGRVSGPFSLLQLKKMAERGELRRLHDISTDQETWRQAGSMPELYPDVFREPPPVPGGSPVASGPEGGVPPPLPESALVSPSQSPMTADESRAAEREWYYSTGDGIDGPKSSQFIRELVRKGELSPDDLVNHSTEPFGWRPIKDAPELALSSPPASLASCEVSPDGEFPVEDSFPKDAPPQDSSPMPMASLVLGIVGLVLPGFGIVGLLLALWALAAIRRGEMRGDKSLAIAGTLVGIVATIRNIFTVIAIFWLWSSGKL